MMLHRKIFRRICQATDLLGLAPCVAVRSGIAKGLKIYLRNADEDYWLGTKETPIQEALAEHLSAGHVFLDIGSNIGFFALIGATCVGPAGRVYAMEPLAENLKCLKANLRCNDVRNVEILPVAASNCEGAQDFFLAQHTGGSTLSESHIPPDVKGKTTVDVATVDGLIQRQTIMPPDLIKIDVEGAEIEVLEGMHDTMVKLRPTIVFEVDDALPDRAGDKFDAISKLLTSSGYSVRRLEQAYPGIEWTVLHGLASFQVGTNHAH